MNERGRPDGQPTPGMGSPGHSPYAGWSGPPGEPGWPPGPPNQYWSDGRWPSPGGRPPRRRRRGPFGALLGLLLIVGLAFVASRAGAGLWSDPLSALQRGGDRAAVAAKPTAPTRSELAALGDKVSPGLVNVNTVLGYQGAQGAGTGIVLSPDGVVLTNNHVINGATEIKATDLGDGNTYSATVVGYDRSKDLAVLQLRGASGLPTATLGDSSTVNVGDPVAAIGNAGGTGGPPTVAGGTVTALDQSVSPSDELTGSTEHLTGLIQVAASVQPGDSGGPLVNTAGEVIGVDTAASANYRYQAAGDTGFAIPINSALDVARQIQSGTGSDTVHIGPTGMLGVSVLSAPVTRYGSGGAAGGVAVAGAQPGSPAARAGLRRGDVITELNGNTVDDPTTLTNLLVKHHPGDQVSLHWVDGAGEEWDATVTLVPGPPA